MRVEFVTQELMLLMSALSGFSLCAQVHAFVSQESNGYDNAILSHTVQEVRVLLGCE
jgi:hypothetical protein